MKKAVILHGTHGNPDNNWFPWLKAKLEQNGYEVWIPQLPDCDKPNRNTYGDFLFSCGWDFTDNIVVGHSSGAVEVLNLLMDDRCPHVRQAVMLGVWSGGLPQGFSDPSTFANLFPPDGFDFQRIRDRASSLAFLHGSDDPYCPLEQAEYVSQQLGAPLGVVRGGGHLGAQFTELPELWKILEKSL